jgi:hypothetical protein
MAGDATYQPGERERGSGLYSFLFIFSGARFQWETSKRKVRSINERGCWMDLEIRINIGGDGTGTITINAGDKPLLQREIDGLFLLAKNGDEPVPRPPITIGKPSELQEAFARASGSVCPCMVDFENER